MIQLQELLDSINIVSFENAARPRLYAVWKSDSTKNMP